MFQDTSKTKSKTEPLPSISKSSSLIYFDLPCDTAVHAVLKLETWKSLPFFYPLSSAVNFTSINPINPINPVNPILIPLFLPSANS